MNEIFTKHAIETFWGNQTASGIDISLKLCSFSSEKIEDFFFQYFYFNEYLIIFIFIY